MLQVNKPLDYLILNACTAYSLYDCLVLHRGDVAYALKKL